MIRTYLKQAWNIIRQNRLFSSIYVAGTALSIALAMTIFVIYYVKVAPIYPEYNRGRTLCIRYQDKIEWKKDSTGRERIISRAGGGASYSYITGVLSKIGHIEAASARVASRQNIITQDKRFLRNVLTSGVNTDFWKVFTFEFLDGRPFTDDDMVSNPKDIIISSDFARELFAETRVAGRQVLLNGTEYRIVGVVKGTSSLTMNTCSDIYCPITKYINTTQLFSANNALGKCEIFFTVTDKKYKRQVLEEVRGYIAGANADAASEASQGLTYDNRRSEIVVDKAVQPYWLSEIYTSAGRGSMLAIFKNILMLLFSILIVPAINLSSMISSRMEERRAEMGVRLAFGATKDSIIKQILWENLLLTCIGGVVGLALTYVLVVTSADWIFTVLDGRGSLSFMFDTYLRVEMLLNPYIFMATFIICLIVNTGSAIMPARWSLKQTITEQLNTKK